MNPRKPFRLFGQTNSNTPGGFRVMRHSCLPLLFVFVASVALEYATRADEAKPLPGQQASSIIALKSILPTDQAILDVGCIYLFEVEAEIAPPKSDELLLLSVTVNGKPLSTAKLGLTPGVGANGKWTWEICAAGTRLDVVLTVTSRVNPMEKGEILMTESRRYLVAYPCSGYCRQNSTCVRAVTMSQTQMALSCNRRRRK